MKVTRVHWCSTRRAKCLRGFQSWDESTIPGLTSFRACRRFPSRLLDLDHRLRGVDRWSVAHVYLDSPPKDRTFARRRRRASCLIQEAECQIAEIKRRAVN